MNKNVAMIRKIGFGFAAGGLVLGAGSASAVDFNASADVQNALAVTVVQDLTFGTLFAANANDQGVASLVLTPAGAISQGSALPTNGGAPGDEPSFLSLGGEQPARGSVASASSFTLTVPNLPQAGLESAGDGSGAFVSAAGIAVTVNSDPDEAAFYLTDFTVGDLVGGDVASGSNPGDFDIDPNFGVTDVEFGIGATINTDGAGGLRDSYQAATYTGTFEVTASF